MIEPATDRKQKKAQTAARTRQANVAGDVLKWVSGTASAQLINVLASPLLLRLFGPDAFGVFALFSSIVGILVAVFTFEYELAIMLPKADADAASIVTGGLGIAIIFNLVTAFAVWLGVRDSGTTDHMCRKYLQVINDLCVSTLGVKAKQP